MVLQINLNLLLFTGLPMKLLNKKDEDKVIAVANVTAAIEGHPLM
jgi:hypothetical protein